MPKSTIGCQIKGFTTIENMNVENLRPAKINSKIITQDRFTDS